MSRAPLVPTLADRAVAAFRTRPANRVDWKRDDFERAIEAHREVLFALMIAAARVEDHPKRADYARDLSREVIRTIDFLDRETREKEPAT